MKKTKAPKKTKPAKPKKIAKAKKIKTKKPKKQRPRLTRQQVQAALMDQLVCLAGCVLCAGALTVFAVPNQVAQSGISGIAVIINLFFPIIPIGSANLALNIPIAILALIFLGWRFVSKTLIVVVEFSLIVDLLPRIIGGYTYTDDRLLATVFAGALAGAGSALILSRGATGGGSEVISWLVRKRWPHLSIGTIMMAVSVVVVAGGALSFGSKGSGLDAAISSALYAAIMIFIQTRIIDAILYGMNNGKVFYIFSAKAEKMAQAVISQIGRGASILPATGAYTGERQNMLMCVVQRSEVTRLRRLVKEHDPKAFMVIAEAQEIFGEGFASMQGNG